MSRRLVAFLACFFATCSVIFADSSEEFAELDDDEKYDDLDDLLQGQDRWQMKVLEDAKFMARGEKRQRIEQIFARQDNTTKEHMKMCEEVLRTRRDFERLRAQKSTSDVRRAWEQLQKVADDMSLSEYQAIQQARRIVSELNFVQRKELNNIRR